MTKEKVMDYIADMISANSLYIDIDIWGDNDDFCYVTELANSSVVHWYFLTENDGYINLERLSSSFRGEADEKQAAWQAEHREDIRAC